MLTTIHTEQRIVDLMKQGAKLVLHYYCHGEFGRWLTEVTLERGDSRIVLSHKEARPNWRPDSEMSQYRTVCPIADAIAKRPDIRRGYPGYISDYGPEYRELYEHKDAPVERWITEQWSTPVTQYDI